MIWMKLIGWFGCWFGEETGCLNDLDETDWFGLVGFLKFWILDCFYCWFLMECCLRWFCFMGCLIGLMMSITLNKAADWWLLVAPQAMINKTRLIFAKKSIKHYNYQFYNILRISRISRRPTRRNLLNGGWGMPIGCPVDPRSFRCPAPRRHRLCRRPSRR